MSYDIIDNNGYIQHATITDSARGEMSEIRIVFDGAPGHESGRFLEVENEKGYSIKFGEWMQDGTYWYLVFPNYEEKISDLEKQLELNASMLAKQCDLAREAETKLAAARKALKEAKDESK